MSWKKFIKQTVVIIAGLLNKVGLDIPSIPSAAAIVVKDKRILVIKLSYKDGYALPGGAPMKGESLEEAVKREVKEETGLAVTSLKYFGSFPIIRDDHYSFNVTYIAKTKGKLSSSIEGDAIWLPSKSITKKLVYEDNKKAIKEYNKRSGE